MSMLDDLLPCPFCGGVADFFYTLSCDGQVMACCADACCLGHHEEHTDGGWDAASPSEQDAAEAWNDRKSFRVLPDVDELSNFIRRVDGNHDMGAGALAEKICEWLRAQQ